MKRAILIIFALTFPLCLGACKPEAEQHPWRKGVGFCDVLSSELRNIQEINWDKNTSMLPPKLDYLTLSASLQARIDKAQKADHEGGLDCALGSQIQNSPFGSSI